MSRSYKKTPYCGDRKSNWAKKQANRKVRRILKNPEIILSNKTYRKVYCSYKISDYSLIYANFEDYFRNEIEYWYNSHCFLKSQENNSFPKREDIWKEYFKYCIRK